MFSDYVPHASRRKALYLAKIFVEKCCSVKLFGEMFLVKCLFREMIFGEMVFGKRLMRSAGR